MDYEKVLVEAGRRLERGERFAMVTLIRASGSTPRKEGARMLVNPDGTVAIGTIGGAAVERIATERAAKCLADNRTERFELDLDDVESMQTGMVCGGQVEVLIESFGAGPRLLLFGAGHVAQPTARLAADVGFRVAVFDPRPEWANRERFPRASVTVGDTGELAAALDSTDEDYIAVMTWCHDEDYKALKHLIRKPFHYLGVIGSKRKAVEIKRRLKEDGFTEREIKRVTCPIGLDIGSHTPDEIAVAVAAQLIQSVKRKK